MVQHGGTTIQCDALPWLPLAPKVYVKIIKLNQETGEHSVMIRAEPGGVLPRHKHLDSAEIFILKGEGEHKQTGYFRPGDYVSEHKDAIHDSLVFEEETELLMICKGPSAFLGPNDETLFMMDVNMLGQLEKSAPGTSAA